MMQPYDKAKMDGFWMYCHACDRNGLPAYAYTPKDAREHQLNAHGKTQAYVDNWWPDSLAKEAA